MAKRKPVIINKATIPIQIGAHKFHLQEQTGEQTDRFYDLLEEILDPGTEGKFREMLKSRQGYLTEAIMLMVEGVTESFIYKHITLSMFYQLVELQAEVNQTEEMLKKATDLQELKSPKKGVKN